MSKTIRVTAIVAVVIEVIYQIVGRFAVPYVVYLMNMSNLIGTSIGGYSARDENGVLIYLIFAMITGVASLFVMLLFMILLMNAANSKNESIVMEICGLIFCAFLPSLLSVFISYGLSFFVARVFSNALAYGQYTTLSSGSSFLGFLHTAAIMLMVISFACSICRKKYVLPLEYEKGIGVEDEYGNPVSGYQYNNQ
ncbi:MAG: hypothetical protein IJH82_11075 [Lachnospiraceae bacterium]|nr:hypothetical protein [Lachnospiraceae bacterium]